MRRSFHTAVGEQGVELNRVQAALCDHRAVALDHGLELTRHIAAREHDRLAAQRAALGAADVEHIGEPCDICQCDIGIRRQAVAEARASRNSGRSNSLHTAEMRSSSFFV